ncbi:MAG: hypothetical protein V2I43_20385 [Parvularcula sp.]|jgi:hypothetical protein|nr:hypothetical protein [Parvularcula sp.]
MREIARFSDAEEAQIAASFLRSQGFEVSLPEEYQFAAAPYLAVSLGGYRLMAAEDDAFLAKAVLDERRPRPRHATCERCGGGGTRHGQKRPLKAFLSALFAAVLPSRQARNRLRCSYCGKMDGGEG